jgi:hypothetical protein
MNQTFPGRSLVDPVRRCDGALRRKVLFNRSFRDADQAPGAGRTSSKAVWEECTSRGTDPRVGDNPAK